MSDVEEDTLPLEGAAARFGRGGRRLIVNADDLGLSAGINRGIFEAHVRGIVTSASLMVRGPAAAAAAVLSRAHPRLSLGLHVDLGEWVYTNGTWIARYEVVPTDDAAAVTTEVARQLAAFRRLVGREPTHLDSHQHVHREEPVRSVLVERAGALGVPLRHFSPVVRSCGGFYGQTAASLPFPEAISGERLIELLTALPPGITELVCHPGYGDDLASPYRREREQELRALCDPRMRAAIEGTPIRLESFHLLTPASGP